MNRLSNALNALMGKDTSGLVIESVACTDYSASEYLDNIYENPTFMLPMSKRIQATQTVDIGVYKKTKDGNEYVENHFINELFRNVNKTTTWDDFIDYLLVWSIGSDNGALIEKVVGFKSAKPDLKIYNPNNFTITFNGGEIAKISISNPMRTITGDELKNFMWVRSPNYLAVSDAISQFKTETGYSKQKSMGILGAFSKIAWVWNRTIAKNGGRINGLFTTERPLNDSDKKEIKDKYSTQIAGQNNNKPLIVGGNLKYQDTSKNPTDTDWNVGESKAFSRVSLSLGVPSELVGEGESTYNNRKEAKAEMYTETIIPWLQGLCKKLTVFLSDQLRANERIWMDISSIDALKTDLGEVAKSLESIKNRVTINEYRKILGEMTGLDTPEIKNGDIIILSGNDMSLEDVLAVPDNTGESEGDI